MRLLRTHRHAIHLGLLAASCFASACKESNDVVGRLVVPIEGPDAAALFDGGQPECDPSAALENQQLDPDWIRVASECRTPESWTPPRERFMGPDGGLPSSDAATRWWPDTWSVGDYVLMSDLLMKSPPLTPQPDELPKCGDSLAYYLDFGRDPPSLALCPQLCTWLAMTVREKIESGCEELLRPPPM